MSTVLQLSRVHYPVRVLGFGMRLGIWFQGCSIGCAGCVSRDTWDPHAGQAVTAADAVDACADLVDGGLLEGITISGGEPFDQPHGLLALLDALEAWIGERREIVDILCYSGYQESRLRTDHPEILARLDALVPGPYIPGRAPGGRWRGSANQPLRALSSLGLARYGSVSDEVPAVPEIQFVVDEQVWMIGVPRPGDMAELERRLAARGVVLKAPSWR